MTNWSDELCARVVGFLRVLAGECSTCLHRDFGCERCWSRAALALLRDLENARTLPPPDETETQPGGWIAAEDRASRRRALVRQLMAEPSHRLPASRIRIPGITSRTALLKFLARQVASGLLAYETTPARKVGHRPPRLYFLPRPPSSI